MAFDVTQYTDLSIYDKTPQDIVDSALTTLQSRLPDWSPNETNVEMALIEAMAIEVAETIYTINRLPYAMLQTLLGLYGVERDEGLPPVVDITFTAIDSNGGYVIPANTELFIPINTTSNLQFFTDTDLLIVEGETTGTVSATCSENTIIGNGVEAGQDVSIADSIASIESAVTATDISGGIAPENTNEWIARGVLRLQRLTDTLLIPSHFTNYALEQVYVAHATTIDMYDPNQAGVPGDHPGYVTVVVYGDSGLVSSGNKALLETAMEGISATNLGVTIVDPTIVSQDIEVTVNKINTFADETVESNITAALENYLSPVNWDWSNTLRYNELIALISNVEGVDYVVSLDTPSDDVTYTGYTNLLQVGTVTVTVV